jgi:hypothetical protein
VKKLCICMILIVGMVIGVAMAFAADQPTAVMMKNKQGEVFFHHEEHLAAVNDCTDCHHMGIEAGGCRDCHGVDREVPRLKHAFHRQCRNCHIKNGGPTECDTCHDVSKKTK